MKKSAVRQSMILIIVLLAYSAVVFLLPFERNDIFLLSYVFVLIAFAIAGVCLWRGFHWGHSLRSRFYGFPIVRIGMLYLAVQGILSLVFMTIGEGADLWIPTLIFLLLLAAAAVGMIAVDAGKEEVMRQDGRTRMDTAWIRRTQAEVSALGTQISDPDAAEAVRHLAEDLRYSDPVSNEAMKGVEERFDGEIERLRSAVLDQDWALVLALCDHAGNLLRERNAICRRMK